MSIREHMKWLSLLLAFPLLVSAKEFEIFDGQYYNGQFYPLIDNIEWGEQDHEPPHMEFHIHQKDKKVDVSVVSGVKGGKPVLWIMYDLAYRGEKVCRRVLAPAQFKEGQKLYTYRDNTDADYDNVYIYSQPWKQTGKKVVPEYTMPNYERCSDENADNMPDPNEKKAATPAPSAPAKAAAAAKEAVKDTVKETPTKAKLPVDYDNTAVPFSF